MIILYIIYVYLAAGIMFSIPYLIKWIEKIDEAIHGSPWTMRLMILPGCVIFWPILLKNLLQNNRRHD